MKFRPWLTGGQWLAAFLIATVLLPTAAHAQSRWLQNVELITPIKDEYVTRALLDSLTSALQHESAQIKRTPEDPATISFTDLENQLFDDGLDFTSATYLFVGYRLEANQRQFRSDITHLYFIYRSEDADGLDIPIFYVEGADPVVHRVLAESGTPLALNEAAVRPFSEQLTFHKLPEGTVVSIGGRVIRDAQEAAAEKQRLLSTIRRFLFQ